MTPERIAEVDAIISRLKSYMRHPHYRSCGGFVLPLNSPGEFDEIRRHCEAMGYSVHAIRDWDTPGDAPVMAAIDWNPSTPPPDPEPQPVEHQIKPASQAIAEASANRERIIQEEVAATIKQIAEAIDGQVSRGRYEATLCVDMHIVSTIRRALQSQGYETEERNPTMSPFNLVVSWYPKE